MIDIGVEAQLRDYLRDKNLFADFGRISIVYFPGGVSGVVALASDGEKNIIIKQALSKLKVKEDWQCDPGRIITEHRAHEIYARLVPESVPATLFADETNKIIGRMGASDGTPMWKTQLLAGLLDFRVAGKAIDAMAMIHNVSSRDAAIRQEFADNSIFYDLRISPYIEKVTAVHPELHEQSLPVIARLMEDKRVLVHGDFSPKNILVQDDVIYILDYEVAHYGHPSFDLAFFFNHFLLKAVKNKQWADSCLNMLSFMAERYFAAQEIMPAAELQRDTAELLAFMLLARVDGKSPAEYIVDPADKDCIRRAAFAVLRNRAERIADVVEFIRAGVKLYR